MCWKCEQLRAKHAPPEDFPDHGKFTVEDRERRRQAMKGKPSRAKVRKTYEQRMAELDARVARRRSRRIDIPAKWADVAVRKARVTKIREILGLTNVAFAHVLGMSVSRYETMMYNNENCSWTTLKLAESVLRTYRQRKAEKRYYKKRKMTERAAIAGVPIPEKSPLVLPRNPELRTRAIQMFLQKKSNDEIARELALPVEVVQLWTATVG